TGRKAGSPVRLKPTPWRRGQKNRKEVTMSRVFACLVAAFLVSSTAAAQTIIQGPRDQVLPGATVPPGTPPPQMPARDNPQRSGTARFRGHVFAADNGQPLRRAQVRATSPELRENRMATTDTNGAYELKDLPAGRYNLNASKGSFVNLSYGQLRPFEPGKPIEILDGQTIEK